MKSKRTKIIGIILSLVMAFSLLYGIDGLNVQAATEGESTEQQKTIETYTEQQNTEESGDAITEKTAYEITVEAFESLPSADKVTEDNKDKMPFAVLVKL